MPFLFPHFGHPEGVGARPWFNILEGELFPAFGHPKGIGSQPWFSIQDDELFPAYGHPDGVGPRPWFTIRDGNRRDPSLTFGIIRGGAREHADTPH